MDNRCGSVERTQTKTFSRTVAQTESYESDVGVEISVGTSFDVGVPFLGSASVDLSVTASYSHSWGKEAYEERTYATEVNCRSPAGVMTTCSYTATRNQMTVPYSMTLVNKGGYTKNVTGTWRGVQTSDDVVTFAEKKGGITC